MQSHYDNPSGAPSRRRPEWADPPIGGRNYREASMLIRSEKGQGLAEYALILALIAIVAVLALVFLGNTISTILSSIGKAI